MPMGPGSNSLGEGLSRTGAPVLGQVREREKKGTVKEEEEDVEVYSDPDEGVQIVDMDAIKAMDWMAPESLRRERNEGKKLKRKKAETKAHEVGKEKRTFCDHNFEQLSLNSVEDGSEPEAVEPVVEKNLANALDLSESEEEEEMEDLIEDFAMDHPGMEDEVVRLVRVTHLDADPWLHLGFPHAPRTALFFSISSPVSYVFCSGREQGH
jgi:DNA-directed RNA polymerase III subunit RPC4